MEKLTTNKFDKVSSLGITDNHKYKYVIDGDEIEIEFKTYLTLPEMSQIVDNTVSECFTSDGYAPEYKEVVFIKNFIDVATNLPVPMMNSGRTDEHNKPIKIVDLKKVHELAVMFKFYRPYDGMPALCELVSTLRRLIDEKLEYQKQLIIHSNRNDEIVDAVTGLIGNINGIVEKYASQMDGVDFQKVLPMIQKLSENKLDKEAIQTILEVGSASKVGSENMPNLEVVK
jgi:hypothetical protein